MKTFIDSSAYAKRFVEEKGSEEIDGICQDASLLAVSIICIPEIISALNRRLREKYLTKPDYLAAKSRLAEDVKDALVVNLTPDVLAKSTSLLEKNILRAMDALHIACAVECGADLFVSADKKQINAATKAGLRTRYIESS